MARSWRPEVNELTPAATPAAGRIVETIFAKATTLTPGARRPAVECVTRTLNLRSVALAVGLALVLLLNGKAAGAAGATPNVVLFLADDVGYHDLSITGGPVRTPNLERLAREGTQLTNFRVSAECIPTRAALLTGLYPQRLSNDGTLDWVQHGKPGRLPAWPVTLAETLRETHGGRIIVGKWHLGPNEAQHPLNNGFTHFQGIKGSESDMNYPVWWKNWTKLDPHQYVTTYTTDVVIKTLRQQNNDLNKAAFVYVPYQAAHSPFALPGDPKGTNDRAKRPEMLRIVDREIGKIMDEVRSLRRPTLVLFLSDNGSQAYVENAPFRGHKRDLYEGGLRVPAIIWMPGTVPDRHIIDDVVDVKDVLPTVADITGARAPADLDGRSIVPLIKGGHLPERTWFWKDRYDGFAALRYPWKMHQKKGGGVELYNLARDPGEARNLSSEASGPRESLVAQLADWRREVGR